MKAPKLAHNRLRPWKIAAIIIPIIIALLVIALVMLDKGGEVETTFQYRLY